MGANDSPITTRSVVNDYFEWRFNNKTTSNSPLFVNVRALASQCESAYRAKHPNFNLNSFSSTTTTTDVPTLNTIKCVHDEIAKEMFSDGTISWSRIITLISFSAILAEHAIQQSSNQIPTSLIISSMADWTIHFIDTDLQTWLRNQNYWAGCQKYLDKTHQRRNSIGRYVGILGTISVLTLGALYMRRI